MSAAEPPAIRTSRLGLLVAIVLLWSGTMLSVAAPALRAGALPWSTRALAAVLPWGKQAPETLAQTEEGRAWQGPRATWLRELDALADRRWPWAEPALAAGGVGGLAHGRSGTVLDPLLHAVLPLGPERATLLLGLLRSLLCALGTGLLALRMGLPAAGAIVAGVVAGVSPWAFHVHLLELDGAVAVAPWLLLAIDQVRRGAWWRGCGLVALASGWAWLTAAPVAAAVVLVGALGVVLLLAGKSRRTAFVMLGGLLLGAAIVPVCLPGWLAWDGTSWAGRGAGWPGFLLLLAAGMGFAGLTDRRRWLLPAVAAAVPWAPGLLVVVLPAVAMLAGLGAVTWRGGQLARWWPVLLAAESLVLHLGSLPDRPWPGRLPETAGLYFTVPLREEGRIRRSGDMIPGVLCSMYGLEDAGDDASPEDHRRFLSIGGAVLDMLAVRQTVLPPSASVPEGELLAHDGPDMRVSVRPFARPWVRFTGDPVRVLPAESLRLALAKASPGGPEELWLPEGVMPGPVSTGSAGLVTDLVRKPGFWSFRVSATGDGHAVLALRFDPAWRVLVRSGEVLTEASLLPAYGGLAAVPVSSGVHVLELRHDPLGLAGLAGQGVATAILALLLALTGWFLGNRPLPVQRA
ncbi:MAG: hypothetical protein VKO64_09595 [Candidatus Sericytochromatia bacterium]|nr:hypothetical protein [Candidatus Sericytochromatia bacterium]